MTEPTPNLPGDDREQLKYAALDLAGMVMTLTGHAVPNDPAMLEQLAEMRRRASLVIGQLAGERELLRIDELTTRHRDAPRAKH